MAGAQPRDDRAGLSYWNDLWSHAEAVPAVDPHDFGVRNYATRRFAAHLDETLSRVPPGAELLEVGCASSPWLPYFAREYPIRVCGLDYAPQGCATARESLRRAGVEGEVVCADLFAPPDELLSRFDVVVSFGVVEHFTNTAACIEAVSRLLKPGGWLLTEIPNLTGGLGLIGRLVNPAVHDMHVPLTPRELAAAHSSAGMQVEESRYFLAASLGLWHLNGLPDTRRNRGIEAIRRGLVRLSYLVWLYEGRIRPLPATRLLSPYVFCTSRKPARERAR